MQRSSAENPILLAKKIGGRYARNAIFFGLLCAAVILVRIDGWKLSGATGLIMDRPLQAAICIIGGPFIGYQFGRWAGKESLVKNKNAFLLSLAIGFASVLLTTLLFSSLAFISEGLFSSLPLGAEAFNYIGKPIYWTCVFASPVIVLVAGIMALFFRLARNNHFSAR